MATLNLPKAFEASLLPSKVTEDLDPLLDWLNQNFDQIIRALAGQITLGENLRGRFISIQATSDIPITIDIGQTKPIGILILKSDTKVRSYSFSSLNTGVSSITFKFDEPKPLKTRSANFINSPNVIYDIEALSSAEVGETVIISGFGNKANNGTFLVLSRTENLITVFNSQGGANETKPAFTGDREENKNVDLFILT